MNRHHPLTFALRSLQHTALLFALSALPFASAAAQSATATLSGTVTDQNGAVVPGAKITVVNVGTRLQREATTNGEGYFVVLLLPPSNYKVRVEGQGFTPAEIESVILNVGDQKALQIQLKAGDVNATVQVINEAPLIDESPAVATVVDRQFVGNLPLNGRSFQSLIALTPGVVLTKANVSEQGQFSVNGQRANANYFTVDGVSANVGVGPNLGQSAGGALPALNAGGGTSNLVSVDALQEFKVQTSTYAPEFGRTPGAQVQILTRSGTNQFRGILFEYFRNEALDANDWFNNSRRLKKPALRQNDFGGVFGGPIIKNRTFFFLSYEGLRLRLPQTQITAVPTVNARQSAPSPIQPLLRAFPLPNGKDLANGLAEFNASYSDPTTLNATSIRIDHTISSKLTLFGRYNYAPSETLQRGVASSLSTVRQLLANTQTLTTGATWAITPTISSEFRANYSRTRGAGFLSLDNFGGATPPPDSEIIPSFASSKDSFFSISLGSGISYSLGKNADNLQRQVNLVNNVAIATGSHQLNSGSTIAGYLRSMAYGGMTWLQSSEVSLRRLRGEHSSSLFSPELLLI
jgi:hypothetical protein